MSEQNKKGGRRAARGEPTALSRWRQQYKAWLAGMTRGERIRYRVLQVATIIFAIIVAAYLALQAWIKVPEVPVPTPGPAVPDSSVSGGATSFEGSDLPDIVQSGRKPGLYTFLVAGKDVSSGGTDTMLLLSYDTAAKTIRGVNLPRDTMINTSSASKRLNAVYARNRGSSSLSEKERVANGMAALKKEVAKITGITPDFYVLVEWEAIGELVDALGGVYFDVPFLMEYDDIYQDPPLHIYQEPGYRLLNGEDAMEVIRFRKSNDRDISLGDVGRLQIQQDFLKAVAKTCLQPSTFLKAPELARIFLENVTTDLTVGNILAFAQLALGMDPDTGVSFQTLPLAQSFLYKSAALVTLSGDSILKIVNDGMNPYLRDIEKGDLQLVYQKSDGSFGVTNAQPADPEMSKVPVVEKPEPEEPVVEDPAAPEVPGTEEPVPPEGPGGETTPPEGEQPPAEGGQTGEEPGETPGGEEPSSPIEDIGTIMDPDLVLPDPNGGADSSPEASGETEAAA